jgi:hypothetical protein
VLLNTEPDAMGTPLAESLVISAYNYQ